MALLPFVLGVRAEIGRLGELAWGLGVAAATTGVIGWFIAGGVDVAMAEGGTSVRAGVTNPTVYALTEIGNLLSWCAPALFMGVVAILLSRTKSLPRWLRVFSAVAGVCGILAPFFFTYFIYLLWTLVLGVTLVARQRHHIRPRHRFSRPWSELVTPDRARASRGRTRSGVAWWERARGIGWPRVVWGVRQTRPGECPVDVFRFHLHRPRLPATCTRPSPMSRALVSGRPSVGTAGGMRAMGPGWARSSPDAT